MAFALPALRRLGVSAQNLGRSGLLRPITAFNFSSVSGSSPVEAGLHFSLPTLAQKSLRFEDGVLRTGRVEISDSALLFSKWLPIPDRSHSVNVISDKVDPMPLISEPLPDLVDPATEAPQPLLCIKRTYQPSVLKRRRKCGFLRRNPKILKRRRAKGRHHLTTA
mmetsp:Transcript_24564/g.56799  ORF Transcript_24564/g.56799 Transcript_24564/m.56799 type:complete len:165 (+) Transcript_24564:3-497(+)